MSYNLIVWDFNGTIVDDVALGINSVNTMLEKRSLPTLRDVDEYRGKLRFPISAYYSDLGFDFAKEPYDDLAHEWVDLYNAGEEKCLPCPGAPEAICAIHTAGVPQIIISASEKGMLMRTLDRFGLTGLFAQIIAQDNIYASGKLESAKAFARQMSADGRSVKMLMIGDTLHDLESAKALGADCALYTGGHGRRCDLEKSGAVLIDDLRDAIPLALQ